MGIIIVTATTLLTAVFINKKIEQGVALFVGIFWITYVLGFMIFIIEPSASSISISGFISSILYGIGKYGSTFMFAPIFVSLVIKDRTLTRN